MIKNRVHVFIDASNIWNAQKAKGMFFDYKKLSIYLEKEYEASTLKTFYSKISTQNKITP